MKKNFYKKLGISIIASTFESSIMKLATLP
ncbi:Uncharacterised protein [Streptococcus pneumoniae]|nr:Uncharacterised protein [Streptococcus pneumoniae]